MKTKIGDHRRWPGQPPASACNRRKHGNVRRSKSARERRRGHWPSAARSVASVTPALATRFGAAPRTERQLAEHLARADHAGHQGPQPSARRPWLGPPGRPAPREQRRSVLLLAGSRRSPRDSSTSEHPPPECLCAFLFEPFEERCRRAAASVSSTESWPCHRPATPAGWPAIALLPTKRTTGKEQMCSGRHSGLARRQEGLGTQTSDHEGAGRSELKISLERLIGIRAAGG